MKTERQPRQIDARGAGCTPAKAPSPRYTHYEAAKDAPKTEDDWLTVGSAYEALSADAPLHAGIIGHASADGDAQRNKDLSLRRAKIVRDALVTHGISSGRLLIAARGSDQPVAANDTERGRELNRRVELFFYYPDKGDLQTQYGVKIDIQARADLR